MANSVNNLNSYKIPTVEILQNRREFYGLQRKYDDNTTTWLKRIENCIRCCEFPAFVEYLLIDRFVCGLNANELKSIGNAVYDSVNQIENIALNMDIVKCEPVCIFFNNKTNFQ